MTWTAPEPPRPPRPGVADERTSLETMLEHERATFLWKCAGLTGEQLALRSAGRSTLSLLGILRHLTDVERVWFRQRLAGEDVPLLYYSDAAPDADFDDLDPSRAERDFAAYWAEVARCRQVVAGRSLDDTLRRPGGEVLSVRALYLHLVAEYARHNGHADLLRENIDGTTGY